MKAYLRRGTARESLLRYKESSEGKNSDFTSCKCSPCMHIFFFLIGNKNFIASKKAMIQVHREYTEIKAQSYSIQKSKKSKIEEKGIEPAALDQSIKVRIRNHLSSNTLRSLPSKALELRSHHNTQKIP